MNGIAEVTIKGEVYALKFGIHAVSALEQMQLNNTLPIGSIEGNLKFLSDLFYCGLYGNSIRKQVPTIPYEKALDLFELLAVEPDSTAQFDHISNAYFESVSAITGSPAPEPVTEDKKKAKPKK